MVLADTSNNKKMTCRCTITKKIQLLLIPQCVNTMFFFYFEIIADEWLFGKSVGFLTYKNTFRKSCENYRQCFKEAIK